MTSAGSRSTFGMRVVKAIQDQGAEQHGDQDDAPGLRPVVRIAARAQREQAAHRPRRYAIEQLPRSDHRLLASQS